MPTYLSNMDFIDYCPECAVEVLRSTNHEHDTVPTDMAIW